MVCSDLQRRGCGLGFLLHVRLGLQYNPQNPHSPVVILSDTRCLFALLVSYQSSAVLLCSVHVDPSLRARAVEDVLRTISDLVAVLHVSSVIVQGDFNMQYSPRCMLARSLRPTGCLRGLRLPYPTGEPTNFVPRAGLLWSATEIDYLLISRPLQCKDKALVPGVSTHLAFSCVVTGVGGSAVSFRRYSFPNLPAESRCMLVCLLSLYWWWLAHHRCHPDVWVWCYRSPADVYVPLTTSPRLSKLVLRRGRQLVEMGGVPDLHQWSQELRDHLVMHGLRLPVTIAGSVSVTSQVSRKVRQATSVPSPYPDLAPCAGVVHATEAEAMQEAVKQLKFYHASKGESVGVIPLFSDAALGEQVYPPDDPSFDVLIWCLRRRVTPQSLSDLQYWLARQPTGP